MMIIIIHNSDDNNNGNLSDNSDLQSDDSCYHISFILVGSVQAPPAISTSELLGLVEALPGLYGLGL